MGLRINTNISSIQAIRSLSDLSRKLSGNFKRLSTGLRIVSAADDAAGLAMSERLRAQIRSVDQAKRNASDGISLVQTAEGSASEVSDLLSRMRELAVQANNGTTSDADRATLNTEFGQLESEINRIARSTEFNGIKLLDGTSSTLTFQVGTGTTGSVDTVGVSLSPALSTTLGVDALDISSAGNPSAAIASIDTAIDTVSSLRGSLGASHNRLSSTISSLGARGEALTAAESRIRDVDYASETAALTRNRILHQASLSVLMQANLMPQKALGLLSR